MSSNASAERKGLPRRVRMRHDTHFVEELAARNEAPIGRMVSVSAVEPDPHQPRSVMGDLTDLVASIQDKGILEPILVRPRPQAQEGGPTFRIISGERRFRAAMEAGLFEVPVIEMDVSEQEALEIALIENLQRKDLTPFEEADGYRALIEQHTYTHEQVATSVGKSRTVITECLALLQLPPKVREAVEALGISTKSLLLEILKAGSEEEMIQLLEEVSRQGLSRDDLRKRLRGSKSAAGGRDSARRAKPYTFKFKAPDNRFRLSLTFRQSTVEKTDLIDALEKILLQLREAPED